MKKIDFVFFDAGGGHRSAATAVLYLAQQQSRPWQIRLVNLQELLAPIDLLRRLTGWTFEDAYNLILKKGWTLGTALGIRFLHGAIRLLQTEQIRLLENHWRQHRPDLVVSFISHFNRIMPATGRPLGAAGDGDDGPGGLSAPFLARTSGAVLRLRHGPRGGTGSDFGTPGGSDLSNFRDDSASPFLRRHPG